MSLSETSFCKSDGRFFYFRSLKSACVALIHSLETFSTILFLAGTRSVCNYYIGKGLP